MASEGLGISLLPELMVRHSPTPIKVCRAPLHFCRTIGIGVKDKKALSNSTRLFVDYNPMTDKRIINNVLGKTQAECKAKLTAAMEATKGVDVSRADEYTVATWLRSWYDIYAKPNVRVATADRYRLMIEQYTIPRIGNIKLTKLTALLWSDLDIQNKTISVSKQYVKNPNGELTLSRPKTETSVRKVSIPQEAVDLLVAEHKKHPDNPYMFPSPATGEMYYPDSVVNLHKKILKDAGLPHIRFHDLRHTFATLALQNGVDVKTVSSMLGHYDAGFTLRTYTHATRQKQDEAAQTMGSFMAQVM